MDFSLIIYIIIFIAIVILIFKIIKKVIFAVITLIVFVMLIFAGIGGLAYFDYKSLTELENYSVNVVYGDLNKPEFGVQIPFQNGEINEEGISSLDISEINEEYLENVDEKNGEFFVVISKELFVEILSEKNSYYLIGTQELSISEVAVETSLNKEEVLQIMQSENSLELYAQIIVEKNNFTDFEIIEESSKITEEIEKNLKNIELKEALFLSVIVDLDEEVVIKLLSGFKEEELNVYPEKFSFKLLKLMPTQTLKNIIVGDENLENLSEEMK